MKKVAVIGLDGRLSPEVEAMAEGIGKDIAEAGCALVCGGKGGVMEAACRGAKGAGGLTVGIMPSSDGAEANEYVDLVIPTGLGYGRNLVVVLAADAVIALNGSTGTLSEVGMALNYGRRVVAVKGSGGISDRVKDAFPDDKRIQGVFVAGPGEAVAKALED